jgi:hypothetical protein
MTIASDLQRSSDAIPVPRYRRAASTAISSSLSARS